MSKHNRAPLLTIGDFRRALAALTAPSRIDHDGGTGDDQLAAWARNWHWNDCAEDRPVDPSIYFRDMRMLKAFLASLPLAGKDAK